MTIAWVPSMAPAPLSKETTEPANARPASNQRLAAQSKPRSHVRFDNASSAPRSQSHDRADVGRRMAPSRTRGTVSTATAQKADTAAPVARRVWRGARSKAPVADSSLQTAEYVQNVSPEASGSSSKDAKPAHELEAPTNQEVYPADVTCPLAEPTELAAELPEAVVDHVDAAATIEPIDPGETLVEQDSVKKRRSRKTAGTREKTQYDSDALLPSPEEDRQTTEKEVLQNAITWCKSLLPKEPEQTVEKCTTEYNAPGGTQVLVRKGLREEEFYLEPAVKKKESRKSRITKANDAVKHTAETLRIFKYLRLEAPLIVSDVAKTLVVLQRRQNDDDQDGMTMSAEVPVQIVVAEVSMQPPEECANCLDADVEAIGNEAGLEEVETEIAPRRPVPAVQVQLWSLIQQASSPKSCDHALRDIFVLISELGRSSEPFFLAVLPQVLSIAADEALNVTEKVVFLIESFFASMSPYAVDSAMQALLTGLGKKSKPLMRLISLNLIATLAQHFPKCVGFELVDLVPLVADLTCDAKKEVRVEAVECMRAICACTGNKDLEPFLPFVVEAAQSMSNTRTCVNRLAGCVFLQSVETPALATLLPVLSRGLNDRTEEVVRTCCQIVDNMCKLVEDPLELLPILPQFEPLVRAAAGRIADPEARSVAENALQTLHKAAGEGARTNKLVSCDEALIVLESVMREKCNHDGQVVPERFLHHVANLIAMATNLRCFEPEDWSSNVGFLPPFNTVIDDVRKQMEVASKPAGEVEEDDDDGIDLYNGTFSLAYGTHTLLRDAKMRLKRNKFYGLLGPNQCGKTTLMRAIANEQLDGFPTRAELKSVFVEHEIPEEEVDQQDDGQPIMSVDKPGWWWVMHTCNDIYKMDVPVTENQVKQLMQKTGFGYPGGPDCAANLDSPVTTYSGGWKMKMQLCAAQLMEADVLMLDEPTGHLDVNNIRWLEDWLEEFPGSIICVSHFSPFLDRMCTHIIDFQTRKLKTFKGVKGSTLTLFVEKYPNKKAYFELSDDAMRFKFSKPGPLVGVKSRSKTILRMNSVVYKYPTRDKPTIMDVSLTLSQISRVAVIGANGSGKTTAIRMLVGELEPTEGSVWKAPGVRLAYVAQHAFHHLERHVQETATQYIMWRFAGNEDRESLEFKAEELTVDEDEARSVSWCIDGVTGAVRQCIGSEVDEKKAKQDQNNIVVPDAILDRRQRKKEKTYEYQVKWQYKTIDAASWVDREILTKMGYLKDVQREDEKQAAMSGLMTKQLTKPGIESHLRDFGVDVESASHTLISQLSGGMKVKLVLAAAMWQNPHVLILDEPTNYLDREGLGALTLAIKDFYGGVVVISHNAEFCESVATEKWIMKKGRLHIEGESLDVGLKEDDGLEKQDEFIDGAGNKIAVKKLGRLSEKEKKKEIKELEKQLKDGKKKATLSEEEQFELEEKIAELKESGVDT